MAMAHESKPATSYLLLEKQHHPHHGETLSVSAIVCAISLVNRTRLILNRSISSFVLFLQEDTSNLLVAGLSGAGIDAL